MKHYLRIVGIALISLAGLMATSIYSGVSARPHHHDIVQVVPDFGVMDCSIPSVPKIKVYSVKKYFGITIGTDISFKFNRANILFWDADFKHFLFRPPVITLI